MSIMMRDYPMIARSVLRDGEVRERMRDVVDALWNNLSTCGVSWVGFYLDQPSEADDRRLVLGPHRDRPACSPIGLYGVCGRALRERRAVIINDVKTLGDDYIACHPSDRSELVVPIFDDENDRVCAVLDLDSEDVGGFDETDAQGVGAVLVAAGFRTTPGGPGRLRPR